METALFDWPVVLQYDVKAKYRLISRTYILGHEVYSAELWLNNQNPPRAFVSFWTNQSNRTISDLCVRSNENRSDKID